MPPVTMRNGISFDEGRPASFNSIRKINTTLNSGFGQDQLKSLRDVKEVMANQAKLLGANYVADFKYGQKNGSVFQQLWSVDNVLWFGTGDVGNLE